MMWYSISKMSSFGLRCLFISRSSVLQSRTVSRKFCGDFVQISLLTRNLCCQCHIYRFKSTSASGSGGNDNKDISSLVQPVHVKPCMDPDGISVGEELAGSLKKDDLLKLLNQFYRRAEIKQLAAESGIDEKLFHQSYVGFRRFCVESDQLPTDLHIVLSDILQEAGHVDDIFPYFLRHARTMFPHLDCLDDLKKISDLRLPANWYPEARSLQRKIIFHAGPTNSGKTHHALERWLAAKSGVYCGPLKMLASEVFRKSNLLGTKCDLVTGEERQFVNEDGSQSPHVACTVEMTSVTTPYEVAVIDEIQMIRDTQRGWAWTRAFLGACAHEVHICGEESTIDLVKELAIATGDTVEVRKYKRLTSLKVLNRAVESFDNVRAGDCIVCFSKNDIYTISKQLEKRNIQVAVIYGTLPPGTKLAQAQKFNDPNDPCKVLVATDAIGMGLNLNIKRIVFYSLVKPFINERGEKEMDVISPSTALQIAGRAGRYASQFGEGEVTMFKTMDLPLLQKLLNTPVETVQQAGLHPTAEQIELFAYHLPKASLSNLIDIFVTLCQLDNDKYFMCNVDDFKFLADMIEHVPLALRARYVFCCAPIPKKQPFVCAMFLKFARQFSRNQPLTLEWLCRQIGWPLQPPRTIIDLVHLEGVFDVLDLYLWLSYRFTDMFPDMDHIRDMQRELDQIIQIGVVSITRLLQNAETSISSGVVDSEEDDFEIQSRLQRLTPQSSNNSFGTRTQTSTIDDYKQSGGSAGGGATPRNKQSKLSLSSQFQSAKQESAASAAVVLKPLRIKPGQRVTDQLVKQGLLTKDMLKRLLDEVGANKNRNKNEDDREYGSNDDDDDNNDDDGAGSGSGGNMQRKTGKKK